MTLLLRVMVATLFLTTGSFAGNVVASGDHSIAWTIGKNGVFVCMSDKYGNIAKCLNQTDPQKAIDTTGFQVLDASGPFGEKASGAWLHKDQQLVLCSLDAALANVVCIPNR